MTTTDDSTKPAPQSETPSDLVKRIRAYHYGLADEVEKLEAELASMTQARDNTLRLFNEAVEENTALRERAEAANALEQANELLRIWQKGTQNSDEQNALDEATSTYLAAQEGKHG